MTEERPEEWKNFEDFSAGIATNRLPATDKLSGSELSFHLEDSTSLVCNFIDGNSTKWAISGGPYNGMSGQDWYESIEVALDVLFIDMLFQSRPRDSMTLIVNSKTRRVLSILSKVAKEKKPGVPQVEQEFKTGVLGDPSIKPEGPKPGPTRDLIGLRTFNRYSPNHLYEHIYLSSERYCWQNLIGEQRGHGDVDLATTYKFDEDLYLFTFREFLIPVASVFFYNMKDLRSTGKFLGIKSTGEISNDASGAYIQKASMTFYPKDAEPV